MTTKELLHRIVDELVAEQEQPALEALEAVRATTAQADGGRRPLTFIGVGSSGRSDISENVDSVLAEGFGRSRSS